VAKLGSPKFPNASSKHLWLIVFYENGNGATVEQQIKPVVETLAGKATAFKVGALDCGKNAKEKQFCQTLHVPDLPAFGFVVDGTTTFYAGDVPSAKALHEFGIAHMPTQLVQNVNHPSQVVDRLLGADRPAILVLSEKYETSPLLYSLAYRFRKSFQFGESRAKSLAMAKQFGVKKYPLVIAIVPKNSIISGSQPPPEQYDAQYDLVRFTDASSGAAALGDFLESLQNQLRSQNNKGKRRNSYGL
jgi:hypothetical protein